MCLYVSLENYEIHIWCDTIFLLLNLDFGCQFNESYEMILMNSKYLCVLFKAHFQSSV